MPNTPSRKQRRVVTRRVGDHYFHFQEPGFWRTSDGLVLREEFRGSQANHGWVAEQRCGDEIIEHFGIGLSFKEAARTIPEKENG